MKKKKNMKAFKDQSQGQTKMGQKNWQDSEGNSDAKRKKVHVSPYSREQEKEDRPQG